MIIGSAGHIDHGKTSLVKRLTGVDTDRLKEEKARGISIDLGFAYLDGPEGRTLGFVDVPGHERFIHNMLAGATGIDFVLLAVAAGDGVMPQTREHVAIVDLLGVPDGVVALTMSDVADEAQREKAMNEVRALLAPTALADIPIMPVSSVTGEGIDDLREYLMEAAKRHVARSRDGGFQLTVDRCFTLAGAGTVVTGTVLSGRISVDDRVIVSPSGLLARVRSIHAQNRLTETGGAGDRCALNLVGDRISKEAISRGDVVLSPELHGPTDRIDATLRILPGEPKPIMQWMPVRLHHGAAEVGARIVLLGDEPLAPGQEGRIQLVLDRPIAAAIGHRFVLRDTSAQRTIGGGRFLDLRAPARKRRTPERIAQLEAYGIPEPEKSLTALLERAPFYIDLSGFARDRAILAKEMEALAAEVGAVHVPAQNRIFALSPTVWANLKRLTLATLDKFHLENPDLPGVGLERLRLTLEPRLPAPIFSSFLHGLAREGEIALEGAWIRRRSHVVRLNPHDENLWEEIRPLITGRERFRPPRVRDISQTLDAPEDDVRRLLKSLGRMGKLDEIAQDHFFARETMAEIVDVMMDIVAASPDNMITVIRFRDRLDNGRKVAIQLLEFFDRHGVTARRGDFRSLNKHRSICSGAVCRTRLKILEENRPRWGVRTSNPGGAASRSLVGSTPILFRHLPRVSEYGVSRMNIQQPIRLSHLSHGGGCGCKLAPSVLQQLLSDQVAMTPYRQLLVGIETGDDAAVWDLDNGTCIIATTDFFMPMVDDPYDFGRIAAANAISDVYAMGGMPILALAILGMPVDKMPPAMVKKKFSTEVQRFVIPAGIPIAGGHSIDCPEPVYGLVVIGLVPKANIRRNADARAGDKLILTKALGVGIYSAAFKKDALGPSAYAEFISTTTLLNKIGAKLAQNPNVHAMTDVTGFSLLGHGLEMARGSGKTIAVKADQLPWLNEASDLAQRGFVTGASNRNWRSFESSIVLPQGISEWQRLLYCDPQTSGGLLVSCAAQEADVLLQTIIAEGYPAARIIGEVREGASKVVVEV